MNEFTDDRIARLGFDSDNDNNYHIGIEQAKVRIDDLKMFISEMMKEGIDFGLLPKTSKKCLFKSGAEKLCEAYNYAPLYDITSRLEDFNSGLFNYEVKVRLLNKDTGITEAEGVGNCNSFESKYEKANKYNIANTVLKMAKKRAFVDAVLIATRSSDIFTQDIEDDVIKNVRNADERNDSKTYREGSFRNDNAGESVRQNGYEKSGRETAPLASQKQLSYIYKLLSVNKISVNDIRDYVWDTYRKKSSKELSKSEASDLIEYLTNYGKEAV